MIFYNEKTPAINVSNIACEMETIYSLIFFESCRDEFGIMQAKVIVAQIDVFKFLVIEDIFTNIVGT